MLNRLTDGSSSCATFAPGLFVLSTMYHSKSQSLAGNMPARRHVSLVDYPEDRHDMDQEALKLACCCNMNQP